MGKWILSGGRLKVVRSEVLMAVTQDYWMLENDAP
jgi:hypothetical protein